MEGRYENIIDMPRLNIPEESKLMVSDLYYLSDIETQYGFVECVQRAYELGYYRKSKESYKVARKP